MALDPQTVESIADLICGDDAKYEDDPAKRFSPEYRTGGELTKFFGRAGLPRFRHDGSTRKLWVLECLGATTGGELRKVILRLANPREYGGNRVLLRTAIKSLNSVLAIEGMKVQVNGTSPSIVKIPIDFTVDDEGTELKPVPRPDFAVLGLATGMDELLAFRWDEAQRCVNAEAFLAATVVMGSLLEGMLLATIKLRPAQANRSGAVPKDPRSSSVKPFGEWSLSQMIDVAHDVQWINLDVKKFSHALRDFRNFIHPNEQLRMGEIPDADTCKMSWLVVQAATSDLASVVAP